MKLQLAAILVVALAPSLAQAQTPRRTITFDPGHTTIQWTLADSLHPVTGTFKLAKGTLTWDPATGAAEGLLQVNALSGESGSSGRDKNMQKSVLESDRFALITYRPTHVTAKAELTHPLTSDQTVTVDGIFSLHGADHPLQMQIKLHPQGTTTTATTHFVIPYVAWGLKDPSVFVLRVGKVVDIDLQTQLTLP